MTIELKTLHHHIEGSKMNYNLHDTAIVAMIVILAVLATFEATGVIG